MVCDAQAISSQVDGWIAESELPVSGRLRAISRFDEVRQPMMFDDEVFSEEELLLEKEAYWDFVNWFLSLPMLPVMKLKQKKFEKELWREQVFEPGIVG